MVTVIFPAAGQSRRMNSTLNKNFLELDGVPILRRTLERFLQSRQINNFIVAAAADDIPFIEKMISAFDRAIKVIEGGSERQYSVGNALHYVPDSSEIVLVHDAARPLVSIETIERVIETARESGAAIAAVPAKNTIKIVDGEHFVESTPPRARLVEVQTPQGFRREIILRAYAQAARDRFLGTDDASLVERLGIRVKIVADEYRNIKITTPEDLAIAEALIGRRQDDSDRQRL